MFYNNRKTKFPMYTPAAEYRRVLNLLCRIQPGLTTVIHIPTGNPPEKRECHIFYKMTLHGSHVTLQAFVVHSVSNENASYTPVIAEEAFMRKGEFWVGAPQKAFKDYSPDRDKARGPLSWVAAYDRDVTFPMFYIDQNDCLFEWSVPMTFIEKYSQETIEENPGRFATRPLTNTLDDGPIDVPPKGATPSFVKA